MIFYHFLERMYGAFMLVVFCAPPSFWLDKARGSSGETSRSVWLGRWDIISYLMTTQSGSLKSSILPLLVALLGIFRHADLRKCELWSQLSQLPSIFRPGISSVRASGRPSWGKMYWTRKKGGKNDRADSSFPMLKILDYRRSVALHMKRPYHAIRIEENVILSMSTDWETLLFLIVFGIFSYFFFLFL